MKPEGLCTSCSASGHCQDHRTTDDDILNFDPWGERDATYVVLANSMVVARKQHKCAICFGPITSGERHRAQRETDDGKAATFRFCAECCAAMARSGGPDEDDDMAIYHRYDIGRDRAEAEQEKRRKA